MTAAKDDIRIVHAGDLTTEQAYALEWRVGEPHDRLQEIAVCGDKVIAAWSYSVSFKGQSTVIDSSRTDVTKRFQRRGIALKLWRAGIARWSPVSRVRATIGTPEGRQFLAHVRAVLAYSVPSIVLDVSPGPAQSDHEVWHIECEWAAHEYLRRLGRAREAKKPQLALKAVP